MLQTPPASPTARFAGCPLLAFALLLGGCLPYSVGQTAETAPRNALVVSQSAQFVPIDPFAEECEDCESGGGSGGGYVSLDAEARVGLTDRSDVGVRFVGGAGFGVTYKNRLTAPGGPAEVAVSGGGGVIHVGDHAYGEATVLVSGPPRAPLVPYGGLRGFATVPVRPGAVRDGPTVGGFAGVRVGTTAAGVSAEIGVFRDPSALGLRERDVIVVPSVTVHGRGLFGGGPFWARR